MYLSTSCYSLHLIITAQWKLADRSATPFEGLWFRYSACQFFKGNHLAKMNSRACFWAVALIVAAVGVLSDVEHPHPHPHPHPDPHPHPHPHPKPGPPQHPEFEVVHIESDFEIRLYKPSAWVATTVKDISFLKATQLGFHKLIPFVKGANVNNSWVPPTVPLLTCIVPSGGPFNSPSFSVLLFLPSEMQESPPLPFPKAPLTIEKYEEKCVAVRRFPGFADDISVPIEAGLLEASLKKSDWAYLAHELPKKGKDSYIVAQYSAPFQVMGRLNEVWVSFDSTEDGCGPKSSLLKTKAGPI